MLEILVSSNINRIICIYIYTHTHIYIFRIAITNAIIAETARCFYSPFLFLDYIPWKMYIQLLVFFLTIVKKSHLK